MILYEKVEYVATIDGHVVQGEHEFEWDTLHGRTLAEAIQDNVREAEIFDETMYMEAKVTTVNGLELVCTFPEGNFYDNDLEWKPTECFPFDVVFWLSPDQCDTIGLFR